MRLRIDEQTIPRKERQIHSKTPRIQICTKQCAQKKSRKERIIVQKKQIYESLLRTPGEEGPVSRQAMEYGIGEGIRQRVFGLGTLIGEATTCEYFPGDMTPKIAFEENEVIIDEKECQAIKTR